MVTFIIGNGFDIQMGLKTRYSDFYKVYKQPKEGDSEVIQKFKKEFEENLETWADFELQLGKYSQEFTGDSAFEDYEACFDDFVVSFNKYLKKQCESIDWPAVTDNEISKFQDSILDFYKYVKGVNSDSVKGYIKDRSLVNFLQFNYTDVFNVMLHKSSMHEHPQKRVRMGYAYQGIASLGKNLHVHGKLGEGGYMTMGVDRLEQIENSTIRDNRGSDFFVKPEFLNNLQARNVNQEIAKIEAIQVIKNSTVICAFGAPIGDTDGFWWRAIGERLKNPGTLLVIFGYHGRPDDGISPAKIRKRELEVADKREETKLRFIRLAELDEEWLERNSGRIIVELDSGMFDFWLPQIRPNNL